MTRQRIGLKVIFRIDNNMLWLKKKTSETLNITTGVAQGSILGTLLFILYINDLVNASKLLKFLIYADDTSIVQRSKNVSTLIDKSS